MKCPCKKYVKEKSGLLKTIVIICAVIGAIAGVAVAIWANWEKIKAFKDSHCKKNYIDVIEFPQPVAPEEAEAAMEKLVKEEDEKPADEDGATEE